MRKSLLAGLRGATIVLLGSVALVGPSLAQQAPTEPWRARNLSFTGSYLSALVAESDQETEAAAGFLSRALARDPNDPILITQTFTSRLMDGEVSAGLPLARRLIQLDQASRFVLVTLALDELAHGNFDEAATFLARDVPTNDTFALVTNTLMLSWIKQGQGDTDGAIETLKSLGGVEQLVNYQAGLVAAAAGRLDEAAAYLEKVYDAGPIGMRMTENYVTVLANAGEVDRAKEIVAEALAVAPHPILSGLLVRLEAGEIPALPVADAVEGAAEALLTLGSASIADYAARAQNAGRAMIYLSLALFVDPDNDYAAFTRADLMQDLQRYERSAEAFGSIPETSPFHGPALVRRALSLDAMDETEIAVNELKGLIEAHPDDGTAAVTLADILSRRERYGEATDYYTKAIDLLGTPEPTNWPLFYSRGITYERTGQWPLAEADFFRALELTPDQPQVLNYLGYTWADRGENLDRALAMIQKAVDLRPNDGYIVDSLGWAHYMLGNYEDAVTQLERAVTLSPEDVTLNDHLGDAYWKVGRTREAVFQWTHARDLGAEGDALAVIADKIANGLPAEGPGDNKAPG